MSRTYKCTVCKETFRLEELVEYAKKGRKSSGSKTVIYVIIGLIGIAALTCIIISMVTGKVTPYLAMGRGLSFIGNAIGMVTVYRKKDYP